MDGHLPVGVIPKKRFGQNFLADEKVVADLVAATDLTREDVVIEVGAGTGVLTKELAKSAGKILAFELDRDLIPVLEKNLQGFDDIKVVNEDFLKSDKSILLCSSIQSSQFKLVGSIPYQITSPLLHKLLMLDPRPSLAVLLIQKEVAEKITAKPPRATYLSNIVNLLGEAEIVRVVPKKSFWPVPEVDGAIVKWKIEDRRWKLDYEEFSEFLHRGFQNPRKMLRSKFDTEVLQKAGIDSTNRAQELSLEDWIKLYKVTDVLADSS